MMPNAKNKVWGDFGKPTTYDNSYFTLTTNKSNFNDATHNWSKIPNQIVITEPTNLELQQEIQELKNKVDLLIELQNK